MIDYDAETWRLAHDFDERHAEPIEDEPDDDREDDARAEAEAEEREGYCDEDGTWRPGLNERSAA